MLPARDYVKNLLVFPPLAGHECSFYVAVLRNGLRTLLSAAT